MRASHRPDAIERRLHRGDPVAQRLVHGILQRLRARLDDAHGGAEQLHAKDVQRLAMGVFPAHEDLAVHAEQRGHGRSGHTVLTGTGLGDDAFLAHALRQQPLADRVVDLVRAGVTQVLALQVDARTAEPSRQVLGEIERRGTTDVFAQAATQLGLEARLTPPLPIGRFELEERGHQRLGNVAPAELPVMAVAIRHAWHCR